jgi:outer membrane protein assembly factor BamA
MAGGYQTFDVDSAAVDDDITSWGLGVDATATFGAFYVSGQVNGGTNVGNLWLINVTGLNLDDNPDAIGSGYAAVIGGDIIDNDAIGGRICVGYTFNEMFAVEIGYGYQQTEYDEDMAAIGTDELESQSYYINFPITLAPGVVVTPEVGVVDYTVDDTSLTQDEITYFGAKWQIDF